MKNSIDVRHGVEGPRHDPYRYTEITVNGRAGEVVLHSGLVVWLKVNGELREQHDDTRVADAFEKVTGITPWVAERLYDTLPYRRHAAKCGGRDFSCTSGYPGETLYVCTKCEQIVDGRFNHAAIE